MANYLFVLTAAEGGGAEAALEAPADERFDNCNNPPAGVAAGGAAGAGAGGADGIIAPPEPWLSFFARDTALLSGL